MRITAVVPTYRRPDKVRRALAGILGQTRPVDEVIVIDNGSPEPEYLDLAAAYSDAPVPVNVVRLSRGTHTLPPFREGDPIAYRETLNLGVALARGDWIAPCHDDDEWMSGRIARQCDALEAFPDAMLIGCNAVNRTEDGVEHGIHHHAHPPHGTAAGRGVTDVTAAALHFNPLAVSGLLFSRQLPEIVGRWQEWSSDGIGAYMRALAASDWDFYRRAAAITRLLRIDEPLVWYEVGNTKHDGHMGFA